MAVRPSAADQRRRAGFTLLELLVALSVLVVVMSIVGAALVTTIDSWDRSQRVLDDLRRGEIVMDQLANALRSTCGGGASNKKGIYAFQVANNDGNPPTATLSWVTASSAFLPPGSPLVYGIHRISLSIEQYKDGRPALAVRAWPYLVDDPDAIAALTPGFLAPNISGLMCRCYDFQAQNWGLDWPSSNALPAIVEITVYVNSETNNAEPLILQRLIEMPLGVTNVNNVMNFSLNLPASLSGGKGKGKGKDKGKGKGKEGQRGNEWGSHNPGQSGQRGQRGNEWGSHNSGRQSGRQPGRSAEPPPDENRPRLPRGNRGGGFGT